MRLTIAEETNEILAIIASQMYSGTYGSALQGKAMVAKDCCIEVIDSQVGIGKQMLLAIFALRWHIQELI
ncbi:MAG: hypothetical protein COS87_04130 [Chloroflexi bacterium CG07_land_8_20_14_0_80_45_17]|nr:MAG: hypothetical protein COX14_02175 [Chloroflexi bacterium CG23_combo_of_CG06-09_8_20_14_all_45_10]PIU55750.1 MAG: hypothetical protein COS87_04130 [Chloroflexi bacterium CG07_land_8_20_14_0_80_45_17]